MKKSLLVTKCVIFIIIVFFASSCGIKKQYKEDTVGYLKDLDRYSVYTDIQVKNDKQMINYSARQISSIGLGYRLELNKNIVMVYKGDKIYVTDLRSKQKYSIDKKFDDVYRLSFLREYIGLLYTNQNVECSYVTKDNEEYELIKTSIPTNNRNINYGVLYVKVKTKVPTKLIIYDSKNSERIVVNYKEFIANIDVNKSLFNTD